MNSSYSVAVDSRSEEVQENLWLHNKTWDLTFISLSASLVILPFMAYELFIYALGVESVRAYLGVESTDILDVSRNVVNGLIALLIGGPHRGPARA